MIASVLAFVGCQNEELVNDNSTDNSGKKVILTANIQGAVDSRVALSYNAENTDTPVMVGWKDSGEKFKVYGVDEEGDYCGTPTWFTQIEGTNQFEGTLPASHNETYLAVYGDDVKSPNDPLQYFLDEQDGTLYQHKLIDEEESIYSSSVLMLAEFGNANPSITFQHQTAILKPTFMVGDNVLNTSITQIVMGNVLCPTTESPSLKDITIALSSQSIEGQEAPTSRDIYIHLPVVLNVMDYSQGYTFTFAVTTADGKNYTGLLTIPTGKSIVAGKLYTANIALTEKVVTLCNLPKGSDFKTAVLSVLNNNSELKNIEFIADPNWSIQGTRITDASTNYDAYMVQNGTTLEIRTQYDMFMFHQDCSYMFGMTGGNGPITKIESIEFNSCVNTSNVTDMSYMFAFTKNLQSLDLTSFNTKNVNNMEGMFHYCIVLQSLDLSSFELNSTRVKDIFNSAGKDSSSSPNLTIKVTNSSYNHLSTNYFYVPFYGTYVDKDGNPWSN